MATAVEPGHPLRPVEGPTGVIPHANEPGPAATASVRAPANAVLRGKPPRLCSAQLHSVPPMNLAGAPGVDSGSHEAKVAQRSGIKAALGWLSGTVSTGFAAPA